MDAEFEAKLSKLRDAYAGSLPIRLAEISALWNDVLNGKAMPDSLQALQQRVHRLAGTGKSYGFSELSDIARNIESALAPLVEEDAAMSEELKNGIGALLETLNQAIAAPVQGGKQG